MQQSIHSYILLRKYFQTNHTSAETDVHRERIETQREAEGDGLHGRKPLTQITLSVRCIPVPPILRLY